MGAALGVAALHSAPQRPTTISVAAVAAADRFRSGDSVRWAPLGGGGSNGGSNGNSDGNCVPVRRRVASGCKLNQSFAPND